MEYKKKTYEFDVKESMKIGEFKAVVAKECICLLGLLRL